MYNSTGNTGRCMVTSLSTYQNYYSYPHQTQFRQYLLTEVNASYMQQHSLRWVTRMKWDPASQESGGQQVLRWFVITCDSMMQLSVAWIYVFPHITGSLYFLDCGCLLWLAGVAYWSPEQQNVWLWNMGQYMINTDTRKRFARLKINLYITTSLLCPHFTCRYFRRSLNYTRPLVICIMH